MIKSINIITATILGGINSPAFNVGFAISAGIVAILSLQPTKKKLSTKLI